MNDSAPSAPRQTQSFLRARLEERGLRPQHRYGQNFLIDLNLLDLCAQTANVTERDVVLEVGTGTGALTALLAERAAHVVSVEIDPGLHALASELLQDCPRVTLLQTDILARKHELQPSVLTALAAAQRAEGALDFALVANLPYHVATPVISNLLALEVPPRSLTIAVQKELADRLLALPSTPDYGALSVWVQSMSAGRLVRVLPAEAFWPRPLVTSALVHLEVVPTLRARIRDLGFFHEFVRAAFAHRRKALRNVLGEAYGPQLGQTGVDRLLEQQALSPRVRADALPVEELLQLAQAMQNALSAMHRSVN